jgi:hypothetical protein
VTALTRKALASFVVLVVSIGALTACGAEAPTSASVSVREGETATLSLDTLTVEISGASIAGNGTLSITMAERDGKSGWDVDLTNGAELAGEAVLTFAGEPREGEPPPVVMYAESDSDYQPATDVALVEVGAQVKTTHFSFWSITWWNELIEPITTLWSSLFSALPSDEALACSDTAGVTNAGFTAAGPGVDDERATWCMGAGDLQRPELQVKNERGYPALVEWTSGLVIQDRDDSFSALIADLLTILGSGPVKPGNTVAAVFSHDTVRFMVGSDGYEALKMEPNPSAYVGQVLRFAVDTTLMLPGFFGKSVPADRIADAWAAVNCIEGFGQMASANPASADAAVSYVEVALDTSLDCAGEVMKEVFAEDAFAIVIAQGLAWVGSAANLLAGGAQAIGDMWTNIGNDYVVTIAGPNTIVSNRLPANCAAMNQAAQNQTDRLNEPALRAQEVNGDFTSFAGPVAQAAIRDALQVRGCSYPFGWEDGLTQWVAELSSADRENLVSELRRSSYSETNYDGLPVFTNKTALDTEESLFETHHLTYVFVDNFWITLSSYGDSSVFIASAVEGLRAAP